MQKYRITVLWILFFFVVPSGHAIEYPRNPCVEEKTWKMLTPYFLPDAEAKKVLDQIFRKRRVLNSLRDVNKAGFFLISKPEETKLFVAKHPKLKGYLIKAYLDTVQTTDWIWWKKRIEGVKIIQASIDAHGYQEIMKTPKKWIYPLPADSSPEEGKGLHHFILVVQEMDILGPKANRKAYKKKMTPARLDAFYTILMENFLIDSVYADNTPFCEDGRQAFIDAEHAQDHTRPVPIWTVGQYLTPEMVGYWEQLIVHGLPK